MRRRIYFVLPDKDTAHQVEKELLLAHIDDAHMHFMAKDESGLNDLPLAGFTQRTDIIPSLGQGLFYGGLTGTIVGTILYFMPEMGAFLGMGMILFMALVGGALGAWISSMIGISVPNSRLQGFDKTLQEGHVLLMVDVPKERVGEISALIHQQHHTAEVRGPEPAIPAFP